MYKLLIVDDERRVREGLHGRIDWASLGIAVCGAADDGETALLLLESERPDILLTDVRMRRMDGLELSMRAKKLLPGLEIVFISGYSDSDYVREALRLDAVDYVYKPVNLGEVEAVMRRVTAKLDEARRDEATRSQMRALLEKSLPILHERFLNDWFEGRLTDENEIARRAEALYITPHFPMWPMVFAVDASTVNESLAQVGLRDAVREAFPDALLCASGAEVLTLTEAEDGASAPLSRLKALCARLAGQDEKLDVSVGVGTLVQGFAQAEEGVTAARTALGERFFLGNKHVLLFDGVSRGLPRLAPLRLPTLLEEHLRAGNREALEKSVVAVLEKARERQDMDHARTLCMQIALVMEEVVDACGAPSGLGLAFCKEALQTGTFDMLSDKLMCLLQCACERMDTLRQARGGSVSELVKGIIEAQYAQKLTIERIARALHYSPTYLSVLYKQETGETIGDELTNVRMRAAMRLLRETNEMIYQIAHDVGFTEQAHFTRLFKNATGMTPAEYRKQALP